MPTTQNPWRRVAAAVLLTVSATAATASPAAGATVDAPTTTLREHVLTEQAPARTNRFRIAQIDAGFGYVAWLERSYQGGRQRIAIQHGGSRRRSAWMRGNASIALGRQTDLRTGRVVVRLELLRGPVGAEPTSTLLSPTTLRLTSTQWAPHDTNPWTSRVVTDAATTASLTDVPEPDQPADRIYANLMAASHCELTLTPATLAVPAVRDCSGIRVTLRGALLALYSQVPSRSGDGSDKGQRYTQALNLFSLAAPQFGWRTLATNEDSYDGSTGLQSFCLLDDGVALVEGVQRFDGSTGRDAVDPWTLRFVPADPTQRGWAVPLRRITPEAGAEGLNTIACSGRSIYARYSTTVRRGKHARVVERVSSFTPRG